MYRLIVAGLSLLLLAVTAHAQTGTIEIDHGDRIDGQSVADYYLRLDPATRVAIRRPATLGPGDRVTRAKDGSVTLVPGGAAPRTTLGTRRVAYILVNYADEVNPVTVAQETETARITDAFFLQASYGTLTTRTDVLGPYTVAVRSGVCGGASRSDKPMRWRSPPGSTSRNTSTGST